MARASRCPPQAGRRQDAPRRPPHASPASMERRPVLSGPRSDQLVLIVIFLGLACGLLGKVTVRTPATSLASM